MNAAARKAFCAALAASLFAASLCGCAKKGVSEPVDRPAEHGTTEHSTTEQRTEDTEAVTTDPVIEALKDQIDAAKEEQERLAAEIAAAETGTEQSEEIGKLYDQLSGITQDRIYFLQSLLAEYANRILMTEREIDDLQARFEEKSKDSIFSVDDHEAYNAAIESKEAELSELRAAEEEATAALEAAREYYEQLSAEKNERFAQLQCDEELLKEKYDEAYAAQVAFSAELEEIIAEFQRQQAAHSGLTYSPSGAFIRPVAGGYISQVFGQNMTGGYPHRGYDIAVSAGTPIMAAANGVVVASGWHRVWGNYVVIDHGNGVTTFYAHCSALLATAGQYVNQGDTIALVGNTGFSFGDHVHIEVAVNGQLVDGAAYIPFA